ncbi:MULTISPECIES: chemotaxis protein CheD [Sphingomonas]|uniref:chemotaxis protein CheD n=1 Tax=Sphingomonas TaxID=13687 RepID=UPI00082F36BE|nr:chemotaxis protein CheD [Sphingomonas sp. CCH10-B3]
MLYQPIDTAASAPRPPVRLTVMQGQARVSGDPRVELTTVLGSCIACCLFDPTSNVGGMNHFLLSEPKGGRGVDEHYGAYLMEVLINEMLAYGASRMALRAHLYGGANMHSGMTRIGSANAAFAVNFLEQERIPLVRSSLGGVRARRADFRPAHGQARFRFVDESFAPQPTPTPAASRGDVELF